jgi:crossover junction endodeoxyribonuclease RuvC
MRTIFSVHGRPIIGIDLSLNATGVCSSQSSQIFNTIHGYGFIEVEPKSKGIPRWNMIREAIRSILSEVGRNSVVFIEGYSFGAHSRSVTGLAEIGGIIRMDLHDHGVKFIEIPPTVLKKFVTGKGICKKDIILKEVYRRWNMDLSSHNLADAFGLVKLGEATLNPTAIHNLTKDQKSVAAKINISAILNP